MTAGRLFQEARDNFNMKDESGEPGEVLLYFLLETVFRAPQLLCKIALKTNRNDEVKGADGIHAIWDEQKNKLVLFIGESKLHSRFDSAVKDTFTSIDNFHKEGQLNRELLLTTTHFKHAANKTKDAITSLLDPKTAVETYDLVHACLVGYDWSKYNDLQCDKRSAFVEQFTALYKDNVASHRLATLKGHIEASKNPHLTYHFIFVPFSSVDEFRKSFNVALAGRA